MKQIIKMLMYLLIVDADNTNNTIGTLSTLTSALTFLVVLPEELQTAGDGYTRTYYVIRYHDGTSEVIETELSSDGTYITFDSDKFSTYTLTYVDTENSGNTTTTTETNTENPQTGDNILLYVSLSLLSIGGLIYLLKHKKIVVCTR